jgi:hypothetical protein
MCQSPNSLWMYYSAPNSGAVCQRSSPSLAAECVVEPSGQRFTLLAESQSHKLLWHQYSFKEEYHNVGVSCDHEDNPSPRLLRTFQSNLFFLFLSVWFRLPFKNEPNNTGTQLIVSHHSQALRQRPMEMAVKYISHSFVARVNFAMVTKKWGFSGAHFFNVILHCSLECKARQRNVCVCLLFFHSADTRSRSMGKDERPWTSRSKPRLEEIFKVKPRTYLSAGRAGS